jgi:hypothetical protein
MPTPPVNAAPRRLILAGLVALLSVLLAFWSFSTDQALAVVTFGGYWIILGTLVLFGVKLGKLLRDWWRGWSFSRGAAGCAAVIVAGGILVQIHEPRGFKILMDEVMLLGSSMSLHLDKTPLVPLRGNDLQGAFQLLSGMLDKRPLFFPVLLSIVHDLTGYRPANAFWLNSLLTFLFLGLMFLLGRRLAGRRGGILAVLLMTSLPLLGQNATGGGFELLNVTMQLGVILLGILYLERRDDVALSAFCLGGVLLAQTRYESVLFILPVAALVAWSWWRDREVRLPWPVILCPLLLVIYPLQNRVFDVRAQSWELSSQPGAVKVFSPGYIYDNIGHALAFFFDFSGDSPNSPLLAAAGLLALPFFLLLLGKRIKGLRGASATDAAILFFSAGYLMLGGLLLCYFWGKFDDPVICRLSLPLHVFMVVAIVGLLGQSRLKPQGWTGLIVATVAFLFAWSVPVMARHAYTLKYVPAREVAWREEFIAQHPLRDFLVIDNSSIIWITHEVSSTAMSQARARKDAIAFLLENHSFSAIYAFQRFEIDPITHREKGEKDEELGDDFVLQTVEERRLKPLTVTRISRVVGVKNGPVKPADAREAEDFSKLSPAEREKLRQKYFDNWLQHLP